MALRRLGASLSQLRADIAQVSEQIGVLAALEETRPLTTEERAQARQLKERSRVLFWELRALAAEYQLITEEQRR